jgi:lipopolysaccharide export system protein LptA
VIWQRWLRGLVAVIGLGCAVALFIYSRHQPPGVEPPPAVAVDPNAQVQSGAGRLVRHRGGQELGSIDYKGMKTYDDGRTTFDQPHILSSDERGFEAWSDRAETKGKSVHTDNPGEMEFTGHVKVRTRDGLELLTDSAVYDDTTGGVRIPGPLTFTRGRMSGQGTGATYDRDRDLLTVLDQAHVTVAPEADGKGTMSATSKVMALDRLNKLSRLEQGATITHDAETLVGDTAVLHWTEDEKHLRLIELRGHASVTQGAGAGADSPPDMHGDDIDLAFYPDGHTLHLGSLTGRTAPASVVLIDASGRRSVSGARVDLTVAPDGKTLTDLQARTNVRVDLPKTADAPARVITAPTLSARGTEKEGLKEARFEGGAEFTETVPGAKGEKDHVRTGKSRVLVLALNGQIDAIDQARFTQDTTFTDGDVHGDADDAQYLAGQGKLLLRPAAARGPKKTPHVTDGDLQVDAQTIDIFLDTHDLDAAGSVTTVNRQSAATAPTQRTSALFDFNDPNRPIYGSGAKLHYASGTGRATYTGTPEALARTWQDPNFVTADEVVLETDTHNLKATGHVCSKYTLTPSSDASGRAGAAPPRPAEYLGTGQTLDYRDTEHVAIYLGTPATLYSSDGTATSSCGAALPATGRTTTAPRIDVVFNDQGNAVDRLDATGGAYAQLEGGREAVGQRLQYDAAADTYTLTSSVAIPARVKLPNSDHTSCTKSMGERLTFTRQSGSADGARLNVNIDCSVSIKDPIK